MVTSTEAGGPAAMTRSMRSGTSTLRPAESTTNRPAVADEKQIVARKPAHSSASTADRNASSADGSPLPHQLAHGAEFLFRRRSRDTFDRTVKLDDPLPHRREHGAAALAATRSSRDRGFLEGIIELL